eukprot:81543-Prymnesium_polylepis.1
MIDPSRGARANDSVHVLETAVVTWTAQARCDHPHARAPTCSRDARALCAPVRARACARARATRVGRRKDN